MNDHLYIIEFISYLSHILEFITCLLLKKDSNILGSDQPFLFLIGLVKGN